MIESLKNIFRIPDLRNRILFTLGMLAIYRLGNHIPTPGVDARALTEFFDQNRDTWFGFVDMFSGGNLSRVTVFALGIMPYISAWKNFPKRESWDARKSISTLVTVPYCLV